MFCSGMKHNADYRNDKHNIVVCKEKYGLIISHILHFCKYEYSYQPSNTYLHSNAFVFAVGKYSKKNFYKKLNKKLDLTIKCGLILL